MRRGTIVLTVVTGLFLAAGALAAPAAKDPKTLILQKADMPAGVAYTPSLGDLTAMFPRLKAARVTTGVAGYSGSNFSQTKGFLQVAGVVFTTASAPKAKRGFTILKAERDSFFKRSRSEAKPIKLPSYGDQQFALYDPAGAEGLHYVELLVRKRSVLWTLSVSVEKRPPAPTAEFLAVVKTFAAKQKARVGRG